jgi:hypothetical protein
MTTSSTAIFVPFMTRELRMAGESLYYGQKPCPTTLSWRTGKSSNRQRPVSRLHRLRQELRRKAGANQRVPRHQRPYYYRRPDGRICPLVSGSAARSSTFHRKAPITSIRWT